jgi:hypothetical protein
MARFVLSLRERNTPSGLKFAIIFSPELRHKSYDPQGVNNTKVGDTMSASAKGSKDKGSKDKKQKTSASTFNERMDEAIGIFGGWSSDSDQLKDDLFGNVK